MLTNLLTWTAIGGFLGLITFLFTVWDRWVRNRPSVRIVAKAKGNRVFPYLRVSNHGNKTILIKNVICDPPVFRIMERETTLDVVRATLDKPPMVTIDAENHHDFALTAKDSEGPANRIEFVISWRGMQSPEIPMVRKTYRVNITTVNSVLSAEARALGIANEFNELH
jgi:hypothetical protein